MIKRNGEYFFVVGMRSMGYFKHHTAIKKIKVIVTKLLKQIKENEKNVYVLYFTFLLFKFFYTNFPGCFSFVWSGVKFFVIAQKDELIAQ